MIATQDYIERKFAEFNIMIFSGALQPIPVRLSSARTVLGQLRYKRRRTFFGGWKYDDFKLLVTCKRDMPESLLEDTIIHEMIHYYILSNNMHDTSAHGKIFRSMMNDINARFHRSITISHRASDEELANETEKRQHYFCISRLKDGRTAITVVAKNRIFSLWDIPRQCPDIVDYKWFTSTNSFFNRYRRSLTFKLYLITSEQISAYLYDAVELVRNGSTISPLSTESSSICEFA